MTVTFLIEVGEKSNMHIYDFNWVLMTNTLLTKIGEAFETCLEIFEFATLSQMPSSFRPDQRGQVEEINLTQL